MPLHEYIRQAMEFNPLDAAEKITDKDYHDDKDTAMLGMIIHMDHSHIKKQLLIQNNDTYFGMSLEFYITTFKEIGFQEIYHEVFKCSSTNTDEDLYCFWEPKRGILLKFDTYTSSTKGLNGGHVYFNWKSADPHYHLYGCSQHWLDDDTIVGDFDCREGVRFRLEDMDSKGQFISPWKERPFNWISTHEDHNRPEIRSGNYNFHHLYKVTEERLIKFPPEIQKLIPPKGEK
jgi:hypothetical protein